MKLRQFIFVGLSVTLTAGAVGAWAQTVTRGGTSLTPRLNPFIPDATLEPSGFKGIDELPVGGTITPSAFIPPSAVRPPFFPSPRSPYFPGPR
jgi:hypothetical protein